MDCSLPGSSVHGILQARILEWVAISYSRGSSRPRDQNPSLQWHLLHWQAYSLALSHLVNPQIFSGHQRGRRGSSTHGATPRPCPREPGPGWRRRGELSVLALHQPPGWQPGQLGFWRLPTWLKSRALNLDQTEFSPRVLQVTCSDTCYVLSATPHAPEQCQSPGEE